MRVKSGISKTSSRMLVIDVREIRGFVEEFGIHILLEVTLVGIVDSFLKNTVLSMFMGICIVESFQLLWRRWRGDEEG